MEPRIEPKRYFKATKLLVFKNAAFSHQKLSQLSDHFQAGDLVVYNRSGTINASLHGVIERSGENVEIRLASFIGLDKTKLNKWMAVSFGAGDWRDKTELRGSSPKILNGDIIEIGDDLQAKVLEVKHDRILKLHFLGDQVGYKINKYGKPIQYSYHEKPLEIWDTQTPFASIPLSVEPPSAGLNFSWEQILEIKNLGVEMAGLYHSAGISSTGATELDSKLPLPEFYEIDKNLAQKYKETKQRGGKVIALGTSVLRALESSFNQGELQVEANITKKIILPDSKISSVDGLLTGMHEPNSSHMRILKSLCPLSVLNAGYDEAINKGYYGHEFGDLTLLM